MPITDYCSWPIYTPTKYQSNVAFKYGDRVIIRWNDWPEDYTVQSACNTARFYDGWEGTVVGISYDYNGKQSDNSVLEIMYEVQLDLSVWWADIVYILQRHLESLDGDIDEEEYEDEIDDDDLEDFVDTAIETLKDYNWKDWDKNKWNRHLIKALQYAKKYLNYDC